MTKLSGSANAVYGKGIGWRTENGKKTFSLFFSFNYHTFMGLEVADGRTEG